jgi:chromosome segregation ATPase
MSETSRQNFPLSHLDFRSDLNKEVLKSATLETLLSQHEETLNRLKISLRRQSRLEDEIEQAKKQIAAYQAQLNEREDFKAVELEKQQLFAEKIIELQDANEKFRQELNDKSEIISTLQNAQLRNDKYHEKIKVQVRPYIEKLKIFSSELQEKNKFLESQLHIKTIQLHELNVQIDSLSEHVQMQTAAQVKEQSEIVQSYEADLEFKSSVIEDLQAKISDLHEKNKKLMSSFDRQIQTENQLIETQRLFDTQRKSLEDEILRLQEANNQLNQSFTRSELERTDYHHRIMTDEKELDEVKKTNLELQSQLEGLRYMWNSKNDECDKYKRTLEALEKLNVDLSHRIQEIRTESIQSK